MQSGRFRLLGRQQLQQYDAPSEVVALDVTEVAIERPKKADAYAFGGALPYAL